MADDLSSVLQETDTALRDLLTRQRGQSSALDSVLQRPSGPGIDFMAPVRGMLAGQEFNDRQAQRRMANAMAQDQFDDRQSARQAADFLSSVRGNFQTAMQEGMPPAEFWGQQIAIARRSPEYVNGSPLFRQLVDARMYQTATATAHRLLERGDGQAATAVAEAAGLLAPGTVADEVRFQPDAEQQTDILRQYYGDSILTDDGELQFGGDTAPYSEGLQRFLQTGQPAGIPGSPAERLFGLQAEPPPASGLSSALAEVLTPDEAPPADALSVPDIPVTLPEIPQPAIPSEVAQESWEDVSSLLSDDQLRLLRLFSPDSGADADTLQAIRPRYFWNESSSDVVARAQALQDYLDAASSDDARQLGLRVSQGANPAGAMREAEKLRRSIERYRALRSEVDSMPRGPGRDIAQRELERLERTLRIEDNPRAQFNIRERLNSVLRGGL